MYVVDDDVSIEGGKGCFTTFGETPHAKMQPSSNIFLGKMYRLEQND